MEQASPKSASRKLGIVECFIALFILGVWLNLFASGILINSEYYRCVINPAGVQALQNQSNSNSNEKEICDKYEIQPEERTKLWLSAWFLVILLFLPLNLALICVSAGVLGTFGSIANLHDDQPRTDAPDYTNPYISGLLRGFFVYLFFISGVLLFDDDPFSNPAPSNYIRLAGFLSLFSFVVNYQPRTFSMLIDMAHNRIHKKDTKSEDDRPAPTPHATVVADPESGKIAAQAGFTDTDEKENDSNPKTKSGEVKDEQKCPG